MICVDPGGLAAAAIRALEAACVLVTLASAAAALTRTPRDDETPGRLYRLLDALALNFGRAKERPPNREGGRFVPD